MHLASIICAIVAGLIALLYHKVTKGIPTRLEAEKSPKSRFELVPASSYDAPAQAHGIDIIFVHGLGSNPDTTWRASRCTTAPPETPKAPEAVYPNGDSEHYVNWVSDFLPADLHPDDVHSDVRQDVRLFFYNYDTYWKRDALPERLSTLGAALVGRIQGIRTNDVERSRHLIFVAYSYGGLVVKKALLLAKADPNQSFITESTKAVLFLGTPHRGSSFSRWGQWQARALWPLGSNADILADLDYDSPTLRDLHDEFVRADRGHMTIYNFYEQRPIRLAHLGFLRWQEYCVKESSATYGGPRVYNFGLSVDHYGLNKFGSRDVNYKFVLSKLCEVTRALTNSAKGSYKYTVPLETVESYVPRDELWRELEDKLRVRHNNGSVPYALAITGLGGVGKSQLALKFAETHKHRYNPILWIDATEAELVRSSFQRCATEIGLLDNVKMNHGSTLADDGAVQAVLQWLRSRTEAHDEWLVIFDGADDLSVGIQKIMPRGERGTVLITSRDELSPRLVPKGCEQIRVGDMTAQESTALLLHHLGHDANAVPESLAADCRQVADKLGHLALAIDLAGAYIGNNPDPKRALTLYLVDFARHRDRLLQMDQFRGLMPTEKTVWTVWDTTLEKIASDYPQLHTNLLLTFLAHFPGTIIQDEMLRLAALDMPRIQSIVKERLPDWLQDFLAIEEDKWDSFQYRQSRDVMFRYSLLKRVDGNWPGVTMHKLVQWRALRSNVKEEISQWKRWYLMVILAACSQVAEEPDQPEFRRHLITHIPQTSELCDDTSWGLESHTLFILGIITKVYYDEGRWDEAEKLQMEVMKTCKAKLGVDHPGTLRSMNNLASILSDRGRWKEAEKLQVEVMETCKAKLGVDHPNTLTIMNNLASTLWNQGRWMEAEKLQEDVLNTRKLKLGVDHPDTLKSMNNLALTLWNQGRWKEAEKLQVEVMKAHKAKLGVDHPDTLKSMGNLALTFSNQGRWDEAGELQVEVMETCKIKLGADHPDTLRSMNNLAMTWRNQGRNAEALVLMKECAQGLERLLGPVHPYTLSALAAIADWE